MRSASSVTPILLAWTAAMAAATPMRLRSAGVRRPRFRPLLGAADGRSGPRPQHRIGDPLLPGASAVAAEPPDAQNHRHPVIPAGYSIGRPPVTGTSAPVM